MDLDLPRAVVGLGFLLVAAAMDWRRRRVRDEVWIAFGAVALAIVEVDLISGAAWPLHLLPAATAILYFGVFFGREMWGEEGFEFRPLRLAIHLAVPLFIALAWIGTEGDVESRGAFFRLLTMPAMIVVAHGLYQFGLLRGGADAKAVMAVALLFPGVYPHLASFPVLATSPIVEPVLAVWFPFSFVVLLNAALLFLVVPILFLTRNAAAGQVRFPQAMLGYRVPLDAVPRFAWLMDRIEEGQLVSALFPKRQEDRAEQVRLLREHGYEMVWVTPQFPFLVALLVGYLLAIIVGNVLLGPFGSLRP